MKIGTIGTGVIVDTFLSAVQEADHVKCTAVCSRKEENARRLADRYGVNKIFTDYDAMLADDDVEFIYIALPNSLHYEYAVKALIMGKNVICEKPFTSTVPEAKRLAEIARARKLFLFEAITTIHMPNYLKAKELLPSIGELKLVQCNYSQYSSRYDKLLAGEVTNIFDPAFSGGALEDINIYNLHFAIGLLGQPERVTYEANLADNGIDTSGIALLKFNNIVCSCTGAKDSVSPSFTVLQGTKGYIRLPGPPNECLSVEIGIGGQTETINEQDSGNRMIYEVRAFRDIYHRRDFGRCYELLDHSLHVVEASVAAREFAGIVFPADNIIL